MQAILISVEVRGRRAHRLAAEKHGVQRAAQRDTRGYKTFELFDVTLGANEGCRRKAEIRPC